MQICIMEKESNGWGGIIQDYVCKQGLKIKIDPKQEFTNFLLAIILF